MSGWIKMRMDLRDDPTVFRLSKLTKMDRLCVIGRLWAFWAWADTHAVDGRVRDASADDVDQICDRKGFAEALVSVRWLEYVGDGIALPHFARHNGESAKERDMKNARQAKWRHRVDGQVDTRVDGVASTSTSTHTSTRQSTAPPTDASTRVDGAVDGESSTLTSTREEKRREEEIREEKEKKTSIKTDAKNTPKRRGSNGTVHEFPPGFERFWSAYPRKVGKDAAAKAFAKRKPDPPMVDAMVVAVDAQKRSEQWAKDGGQFIPHPSTWLNEGRWQDGPAGPAAPDPDAWKDSRSAVINRGCTLGFGPWDLYAAEARTGPSWEQYRRRVIEADSAQQPSRQGSA